MQIAFVSSYLNHHQAAFCDHMYELLEGKFVFVSTKDVPEFRRSLGYADMGSSGHPYVLEAHKGNGNLALAKRVCARADVVIIGAAPEVFVRERIAKDRLTFWYSERFLKEGDWKLLSPAYAAKMVRRHTRNRHRSVYLLSAGAYAARDYALIGAYRDKAYKWGYFPEFRSADIDALMAHKSDAAPRLLWVGRFVGWKRPHQAILVARELMRRGLAFQLEVVGEGPLDRQLRAMVETYHLADHVAFTGPLKPDEVRRRMDAANILMFTSNAREGWGVVLNEAMNSACAVVACSQAGSVPYLVADGQNGFVYGGRSGDLFSRVADLVVDPARAGRLGRRAYDTVGSVWNPRVASERLVTLSSLLLAGASSEYLSGPGSPAT